VVVDGVEEPEYDQINGLRFFDGLCFSPDSQHVVYVALRIRKWWVFSRPRWRIVVDDEEGPAYDDFPVGSRWVFDSPQSFHAVVQRGQEIFRVGVEIVEE
jgi:hypothetical protein